MISDDVNFNFFYKSIRKRRKGNKIQLSEFSKYNEFDE